ncbi:hypothetical protein [Clostridium algidicarnis]|uniref:hypothetical protein n=1 Tax=Clostridium algidicarnis TaxID=37659 RepID=UPI003FD70E8B
MEIKYDTYGRMTYNPLFHANNSKRWSKEDEQYLIDWYYIVGPEEISYALDRTIATVMGKAAKFRKEGLMVKPARQMWHGRIRE